MHICRSCACIACVLGACSPSALRVSSLSSAWPTSPSPAPPDRRPPQARQAPVLECSHARTCEYPVFNKYVPARLDGSNSGKVP
eukprot:6187735-Pleurochrysis_carterae.AAC.1